MLLCGALLENYKEVVKIKEIYGVLLIIGGIIGGFITDIDPMLKALAIFTVVDFLTGVLLAANERKVNSGKAFLGLARKITIVLMVILGYAIDNYILKGGNVCQMAIELCYIVSEGISITENVDKLGLPIPKKLKNILEQLDDEN